MTIFTVKEAGGPEKQVIFIYFVWPNNYNNVCMPTSLVAPSPGLNLWTLLGARPLPLCFCRERRKNWLYMWASISAANKSSLVHNEYDTGAYVASLASSLVYNEYDTGAYVVSVASSLVHNNYDTGAYVASGNVWLEPGSISWCYVSSSSIYCERGLIHHAHSTYLHG